MKLNTYPFIDEVKNKDEKTLSYIKNGEKSSGESLIDPSNKGTLNRTSQELLQNTMTSRKNEIILGDAIDALSVEVKKNSEIISQKDDNDLIAQTQENIQDIVDLKESVKAVEIKSEKTFTEQTQQGLIIAQNKVSIDNLTIELGSYPDENQSGSGLKFIVSNQGAQIAKGTEKAIEFDRKASEARIFESDGRLTKIEMTLGSVDESGTVLNLTNQNALAIIELLKTTRELESFVGKSGYPKIVNHLEQLSLSDVIDQLILTDIDNGNAISLSREDISKLQMLTETHSGDLESIKQTLEALEFDIRNDAGVLYQLESITQNMNEFRDTLFKLDGTVETLDIAVKNNSAQLGVSEYEGAVNTRLDKVYKDVEDVDGIKSKVDELSKLKLIEEPEEDGFYLRTKKEWVSIGSQSIDVSKIDLINGEEDVLSVEDGKLILGQKDTTLSILSDIETVNSLEYRMKQYNAMKLVENRENQTTTIISGSSDVDFNIDGKKVTINGNVALTSDYSEKTDKAIEEITDKLGELRSHSFRDVIKFTDDNKTLKLQIKKEDFMGDININVIKKSDKVEKENYNLVLAYDAGDVLEDSIFIVKNKVNNLTLELSETDTHIILSLTYDALNTKALFVITGDITTKPEILHV